jgi:hypothetical protein
MRSSKSRMVIPVAVILQQVAPADFTGGVEGISLRRLFYHFCGAVLASGVALTFGRGVFTT